MTAYNSIKVEKNNAVVTLCINKAEKLNALDTEVIKELTKAVTDLDHSTRAIVIEGAGEKAFVAGADIAGMSKMGSSEAKEFALKGQKLLSILEHLPQVVIAKVQGFALGGGCELAMGCDIIIAAKSAKFGQPEVNLGIIPGFGGTQRLPKRVGLPIALDMLLCGRGRTLKAEEAYQAGLISRVVENDELDATIAKVLKSVLSCGPNAIAETKRLARQSYDMTLEAGLANEATAFGNCFAHPEHTDGIEAFLNKSAPKFSV